MAKRITEEQLGSKTDNKGRPVTFIKGSLRFVEEGSYKGKQVVDRKCDATKAVYTVATSDLHQCFYCPDERPTQRKIKAKALRAAAKAEKEAKAEAAAA